MHHRGIDQQIRDANRNIRAYVRSLPRTGWTVEQRAEYEQLVDAYLAAVRERDAGGDSEDELPSAA